MPPRDPSLPEGTDSIIDTNTTLGGSGLGGSGLPGSGSGTGTGTGSGGLRGADTSGGGMSASTGGMTSSSSSAGGASDSAFGFDKTSGGTGGTSSGVTKAADSIVGQVKEQVSTLKSQAGDRALGIANDGKRQATDFLTTVAQIIQDAAGSVEDKLGSQYSGFGNRAADQVSSLARTLDERNVDDLIDDARSFVRRSPAIAIGIAALVGFAVARVVRSGLSDNDSGGSGMTGNTSGALGQNTSGTPRDLGKSGTTGSTGTGNAPTY